MPNAYRKMTWEERIKTKHGYKVLFVLISILIAYNFTYNDLVPTSKQKNCIECHNRKTELTNYFKRNGVDHPEKLAVAVLSPEVKRPKLMAALAVKESPRQKTGDGGQSKGYFQVKEKHWKHLLTENKVSNNAVIQVMDSQRILEALIEEKGSVKKGLEAYGGSTTGRYSNMILAELVNVP